MKTKAKRISKLLLNVPTDVKAQFKAYCAKREKTMSNTIIEFMTDIVKRAEDRFK